MAQYFNVTNRKKRNAMKHLNILLIALLYTLSVNAQEPGPVGLGIRANPDGAGITAKYLFTDRLALESQLNASSGNYNDNGTSVTIGLLLEQHFDLWDPSWRIFIGGGFHVGTWNRYGDSHVSPFSVFGLDAIGGIEYLVPCAPIGISVDVKPSMNFISGVTTFPNNTFGLAIRYYFGHWGGGKYKLKVKDDGRTAGGPPNEVVDDPTAMSSY
jgi:hypothetical protein